jgi:hypothetical protein
MSRDAHLLLGDDLADAGDELAGAWPDREASGPDRGRVQQIALRLLTRPNCSRRQASWTAR